MKLRVISLICIAVLVIGCSAMAAELFDGKMESDEDRRENWTWSRGLWEVITEGQDAGAVVEKNGGEAYIYHNEYTLPDTFKITAQVKLVGDTSKINLWGGILFNYQSDNEFYVLRFKADHADVQLLVGTYVPGQNIQWSSVLSDKLKNPLPSGEYVTVVLKKYSNRIEVVLNGQEVVFYTRAVSNGGKVGYYAGLKPNDVAPFYFKGLVVESL